jgi:hypothetical protein
VLTKDRNTLEREAVIRSLPVKASAVIHAGALVMIVGGAALAGAASAAAVAVGRCEEQVTGGASDGDTRVKVKAGTFCWANSATDPVALADIGKPVFIEDDHTIARTDDEGTLSSAGILFDVDATGVWVTTA